MESNKGFKDVPLSGKIQDEDRFDVMKYVKGLASFISNCDTPMTIAIQGDWGSGKTSMMNMIQNELSDNIIKVYFNTWQYSQFNMGDELSISFLSQLIDELREKGGDKDSENRAKRAINLIKLTLKKGSLLAIDTLVGGKAAESAEELLKKMEGSDLDLPQSIKILKDEFQNCVDKVTGREKGAITNNQQKRVVFFVDDLDRLNPGKAVELLEVLKLFMDCEGCVFVLAIDYNVVSKGVKEKYGDMLGEEKGRSFFDKIIQVPFKMPVALYEVKTFVRGILNELGIYKNNEKIPDDALNIYVDLIRTSISCNPRAMKRLFNAYLLLMNIYDREINDKSRHKKILFAILCMQQAFEEIYDYLITNIADISDSKLLSDLTKPEGYVLEEDSEEQGVLLDKNQISRAVAFMSAFIRAIDEDHNESLDSSECKDLEAVLTMSKITASGTTEYSNASPEVFAFRRINRNLTESISKTISPIIKKAIPGASDFISWQVRKERSEWNYQDCCSYVTLPNGFNVAYKIRTDLAKRPYKAELYVYAGPRYRQDPTYFNNIAKEKILNIPGYELGDGDMAVIKRIPYEGEVDDKNHKDYCYGIESVVIKEINMLAEALRI